MDWIVQIHCYCCCDDYDSDSLGVIVVIVSCAASLRLLPLLPERKISAGQASCSKNPSFLDCVKNTNHDGRVRIMGGRRRLENGSETSQINKQSFDEPRGSVESNSGRVIKT